MFKMKFNFLQAKSGDRNAWLPCLGEWKWHRAQTWTEPVLVSQDPLDESLGLQGRCSDNLPVQIIYWQSADCWRSTRPVVTIMMAAKEIHSSMFETRTIFVFRLLFLHEWFSTAFDVKVFNYFFNFLSTKRTRNFFSPNFLSARITVSTMTWFTMDDSSIAWADETQEAIVILFHSVGTGLRPGLRFHTAVRRLRAR